MTVGGVPALDPADNPLLTRLRRLCGLDEDDLSAVHALCATVRTLPARAILQAPSSPVDGIFVLLDGWACGYRPVAGDRRQIVRLMMPGDICNLAGLFLRRTGLATETLTPATVAVIEPDALRALAVRRPRVGAALTWLGAAETERLAERMGCLGRRSAREHVAHLFCELLVRLTSVGEARGRGYTLPLTQDDLADLLGITAVHVNRTVQVLRREGLIRYVGRELVICDWRRLCDAAHFDGSYLHLEGIDGTGADFSVAPWAFGAGD